VRALEDERLALAPGTASTLPPRPPPERHRATAAFTRIGVIMLMIFGALPLYFTVTGLGPAIRAARGEGTTGYFIPSRRQPEGERPGTENSGSPTALSSSGQ
jgi:hypothetical protein